MISLFKEDIFKKYFIQFGVLFCLSLVIGVGIGMYVLPHSIAEITTDYVFDKSVSAQLIDHAKDNMLYTFIVIFVNNIIVSSIFAILFPIVYYSSRDEIDKMMSSIKFMKILFFLQLLVIWIAVGYIIPLINNNLVSIIALVPHGIIEIPALIISAALGAWFMEMQINKLPRTELYKMFIVYVAPLLFVAALIETYITPVLVEIVIRL